MSISYKSSTALTTGSWQHLAVTIDQTNGKIAFFLNNKIVGTQKASNIRLLENSEDILIGRNTNSEFFNGMMDDVRLYSRVLSASELAGIFNYKSEGNLIAKYDFEKYDVNPVDNKLNVYDEGPHGYHGVLEGMGANTNVMTRDVGEFAIKETAFETLADEYVVIDGTDPTNKLQGVYLNNCTFAAWVKLGSASGATYEPIISKDGVFSFGVNAGKVCLKLGDGTTLHELPMMSMADSEMEMAMETDTTDQILRVVGNGYTTKDAVPASTPASSYFQSMGYRSFEWNFKNTFYDNSAVFKFHTVDARSKTANQFAVDDKLQMAAGFGSLSENGVYVVRNWCRETNNEYWYLRAGYDGMEMPSWSVGSVPLTLTLKFKFLDVSNFLTSAVSILYGVGASDEGFAKQTWNDAKHENHYICGELYGNAATTFQMRCSIQEGSAGNGRVVSTVFTGGIDDVYTNEWNYMVLVHDPASTQTRLYLNHVQVCSVNSVATLPEASLGKLRVGTFPIDSANYVNRGIYIKGVDFVNTAMTEEKVHHYLRNRYNSYVKDNQMPSMGLVAHYSFDGDQPHLPNAGSTSIVNGEGLSTVSSLVEGSMAANLTASTSNLEISGEVFSSDKTFFFGTWINADTLTGYRPILSRIEGDNNMQFGVRNGNLEFSLSKSKPVSFTDVKATHILDYQTGVRTCEVVGNVTNSTGGTVHIGLLTTPYGDLMKNEVKTFVESVLSVPDAIKTFAVPADSIGVSIASTHTNFFSSIESSTVQPVEHATNQLYLLILMLDTEGNPTVRSYALSYEARNNQTGEFSSRTSEVYLSDGYTYSVTTMREANTSDEFTDWYLVMNYLRKQNENVRSIPRAPKNLSSGSNLGYEGFPIERQQYDSVDIQGDFASETYETMDLNAKEYGPWGHVNNDLFGMLVDDLGDQGVELLFKGKTSSHDRVMNFSTGWSWLVDYFRNGFEVAPGGFNTSAVSKRADHTTYLPDETTTFPDNKMEFAMTNYPFYHSSYRNYLGADNNSYWSLDESAQNTSTFQQIWVRGRRSQANKDAKPILLSGNDNRNKSLAMGDGIVAGEPYTMTLVNGDTVEMSACYNTEVNKKVSNLFSHSMNDNNHSSYGSGDDWRALYTFKEAMEVTSMKFYQAESYQTKGIEIYYTTDDSVKIDSPLDRWTQVDGPSATEFHSNTTRTVLRIDFAPVKARRFMIVTSKWTASHTFYGLMEWMIFGYDARSHGVVSDMSDKNSQHNSAGKYEIASGYTFNPGQRSMYRITDTADPYNELFLKHMSDNVGKSVNWNGNDSVVKAQLNNGDTIYYNCVHSYSHNTGWYTYDATNLFNDESVLNVTYQNAYNTYQDHGWMFARSDSIYNRRTGSLIYEFANGRAHQIRGIRVWGKTISSKGFSAKVRVFFSMSDEELEFVEFGEQVASISLLESDTSTLIDLGDSFPMTKKIMLIFESCWDENIDVKIMQLQLIGEPQEFKQIVTASRVSLTRTENVVTGFFNYTNLTGKAKLYLNAYAYDYSGPFASTTPLMTLLPTSNKTVEFEIKKVYGIDGSLVPANAVNYVKVLALIEDSVYGTKKLLNTEYLLPSKSGEIALTVDKLFFDTFDDKVSADLYAYSSYAGLTAMYTLLTEEPVEEEDENDAKNFMLQNSANGTGCVDYKSLNVVQYGIASENFKFTHGLSKIGGVVTEVVDGRSYYLSVLIQDSSGGVTFTKRLFPTKLTYYDLDRVFAAGHDSSSYITGFGGNANIRNFGEGATLNNWLKTKPDLVVREIVGGGFHAHLWCYQGDQDVVYSWGSNGNGELAYISSGSTTHNTSTQVTPIESNSITDFLRSKNATIVQFKAGNNFGMMLLSDGKMYSWGAHSSYATGFATTGTRTNITECDIFTTHCVEKGVKIVDFCCTFSDTIILFSDGSVWGIGSNSNGLLGLGHENATGGVLMSCTNVNLKLEDGYVVDMLSSRGYAMTYRLKNKTTGELSWWGLGRNSGNRLGVNAASPVLELTHLNLTDELISTFPDPKNYTISVGPTHWENCYIIDLTSNRFWFIGDATYLGGWSSSNTWVDRSAEVNMGTNKFVFCAPYSYGMFMGITNDRSVVYKVPDTRSIITSNRLNVRADSARWSASTGLTFTGTISASDVDPVTTYSFYATSNFEMTKEQAVAVFNAGTSTALQSATLNLKAKVVLKDYMVRNIDVQGSVVPSISYSRYKLFVYAASATQQSMEVLTNDEGLVSSLFANVTEGSYDPFTKTLQVRASVTDNFNTPTNLYVAAFAEPPPTSLNNQDIKQMILNIKHLPQVQKPSVTGVGPEQVFLTNTLTFTQVFNSIYPEIDEATYELMKVGAGTDIVSQNSADNVGLTGSTSDATWYEWSDKYQSGQTVKKWTLHNGDSLYTNSHGEKWFDGNQTDDANYQPQMYNTNETWTVEGVSRSSVKSWRYFYNVAEPRTINCFKLFNHSSNGAHFINTIGVWNSTTQVYEPLQLSSNSFPLNCFAGTSTSAYQNVVLKFEPVTLEPGKPLMIHLGRMSTNLYINEMQLVYETPPPVIPTFFKYMKLHVRANNGSSTYFAFADVSVAHMEISNITTSVSTAHGHAISRIADNDPTTYHQTYDQRGFNVFLTFTHGLGSVFDMKFVNIWNDQGWKDVDVYVSTDNSNWMLSKEIRGLTYGAVDDMIGRTTHVSCSLPPNVVTPEDIEYSIYAVAQNSVAMTSISKFVPPPVKKAYIFDRVKSLGYNNYFETGQGEDKNHKLFEEANEVTKFLEANPNIQLIDIIGAAHHTIFEVRNNGAQEFYGIGYNSQRGLGGFNNTSHQSTVVECTGINALMLSQQSKVVKVNCGWHHTMVLLENGKMFGFGYNSHGQLGTNNTSDGGTDGRESVMINEYCEQNNTEVVDFACTAYNTFVYLKNNTVRVAGRWNGHGQLGRSGTSETTNSTFHHVSQLDTYLNNAKIDFMKCDYGSVMYRIVNNDTGEAKWYGAGQNTNNSIGYSGAQITTIVECDLLNTFIDNNGLHNKYEVIKGMMHATLLIDTSENRVYGIGSLASNNDVLTSSSAFMEVISKTNGTALLNYDTLVNNLTYPMRPVKYATNAYGLYVGGTDVTGPQPFEYVEPPLGNLNILRVKNVSLSSPDESGVANLFVNIRGSVLQPTRYYVVLTTDDRTTYDFNDEVNADAQATYKGVIQTSESLNLDVGVTEISDIDNIMTSVSLVSKVRAYVFATDGTHKDYQVYDFGPFVTHPNAIISSVSFSPITDQYQVDMQIGASKEAVLSYNMLVVDPNAELPEVGEPISYDRPLIVDSHGTYDLDADISKFTVSGWVKPAERTLLKKAGAFEMSIGADGKMVANIESIYRTSHLERQVETPASSTFWRFKIYKVYGSATDYATFTQLVLTDDDNTYPTTRYDQGANTLFDRVGTTNTNVNLYNHKVTYEYASGFTPTKMIWAYKATDPARALKRVLIQYCTTTSYTTEADWVDYVYVNLDVDPATNTTPTFHYVDVNVVAQNTPRTITFTSPNLFPTGGLELISPVNTNADDLSIADFIYMQSTYFADQPQNLRGPVKYLFNQTYRADGNIANYGDWHGSLNTGGIWAVFNLGSVKSVTHMRIWQSRSVKEMPHDFKIAMFDDTTIGSLPLTDGGAVSQLDAITAEFQYSIHTPEEHTFMLNGEKLVMDSGVFGNETTDPMVVYSDQMNNENVNETNGYHEFNLSNFNLNGRYMVIGFYHNPVTSGEYTKLQELRLYTALPPPDPTTIPYQHFAMTVDATEESVVIYKNGQPVTTLNNNLIRMPSVDSPYILDSTTDTRYVALRKGALSKKNVLNDYFSGRQDLIDFVVANSTTNTINLPAKQYDTVTAGFTSAVTSLDNNTSVTVMPKVVYPVFAVLSDVNGSVLVADLLQKKTEYTTVTYGWASGHNNGYMMMFTQEHAGSPDFYPTHILHDFLNANPTYKCINIEMGGYALMCMIQIDGVVKLYSTGYNAQGQIGNGNTSNQSTMVEATLFNEYAVQNSTAVKMVRCGWNTTCVLYENGIVMCVGTNSGCYANGNDTASSTALVEASLVTAYCRDNDVEIVDFAIANGECCYLFSNGKVLGNGYAMGTADNAHNLLKETALNDLMGTDYECTLMRSMSQSFNFRLTHKITGEEKWYGTGQQYHNGGGAAANQTYYTVMTPLTKLEALLASFEDPKDYTYVMGCYYGASFVRDNRTDTFWRIGYMGYIPKFGNTTEFVEVTEYITKEWCETDSTNTRLTNFTPVYWRMNAYGIFAFGNPLGVEPDVYGGNPNINLSSMSIDNAEASFDPLPEPIAHIRHSDVGVANNHSIYTTSTESGMTYVQTLSNGDKAHSSGTFVNERNVSQIFTGIHDHWGDGAWHGPNGATTMSAIYEFTSGDVLVDTMNFVNVPGNAHWAGDIQILYWNGTAFVDVVNRSAAGFSNAVHSEEISITFDEVSSFKFKIVVDRHVNNTTTYVGLSEWSIHGFNRADTSADSLEAPIDVYFTNPDYTLSSYPQKPTISELTLYSGPDYTGDVVPYTIEAIHIPTGHPGVYTPLELHTRFTDGINEGTYWYSVDPSGTGTSSSTGLETMDGVDVKFFTIKPSAPVRSAKVVMLMLHMAPAIKLVQGSTEVRAGGLRSLYPSEQEYWDGGLSGTSSATDSILFYAGLNLTSSTAEPFEPPTMTNPSITGATLAVNTNMFSNRQYKITEIADPTYEGATIFVTANEVNINPTFTMTTWVTLTIITNTAVKDLLPAAGWTELTSPVLLGEDMVQSAWWDNGNTKAFTKAFEPGTYANILPDNVFKSIFLATPYSPPVSTDPVPASPVLYTNLTMTGSETESTYYVVASLDYTTMDVTRMNNLVLSGNSAVVSGKLDKKAKDVVKSVSLQKVIDTHNNVYSLTAVPFAYVFVYLKDQNGLVDFHAIQNRVVREGVDLSVPYMKIDSGVYDSGTVSVQGTLFNSSVLTGYYVSAFTSDSYLVSATPTDLPSGESMLAISTVADVPFVFNTTLDTVYADDTYASSSDIFGNEGQLALRLITTDGTTPAFKDFDYAMGDFIVSTVATYASTNDSITATVTKKNNTANTKYTVFASEKDLTSKQILDIIVGKAFASAKIRVGDTNVGEVNKVISLSENKLYDVQDISKVSLYTLGTNHMPASVAGNVEIEVDGVRMPASTDTEIDSDDTKTPWILVLNYKNNGGAPIPYGTETWRTVEEGLPVFDDEDDIHTVDMSKLNTEHTLETLNNGPWGHTGNDLFNKLAIALGSDSVNNNGLETRWVARTVLHNRKIHFKSGNSTLMTALRTGSGNINSVVAADHTAYADHTADIPQTANGNQANLGNVAMTYLPLHNMSTNVLWSPERWAVDEGIGTRDGTWFQIWVRADLANCPQAMKDALIPDSTKMLGSLSVPFSIAETHVSRTMPSVNIGETEIDSSDRLIVKNQLVSTIQPETTLYTFGLKLATDESVTHTKNVSASGGQYLFDGVGQPTITMYVGDTLTLVLDVLGHPLWIKTVNSTGTSNTVANAVNNGGENGVILWTPTASGTYYYNCEYHGGMYGTIEVLDKLSRSHLNTDHVSTLANHIFASDVFGPGSYVPVTKSFNIRAESGYYYLNDVYQPTVDMNIGDTIVFTLDGSMSGHPLWIKTERSTGNNGAVSGVINNGANTGQISWTPTAADTYYYNCEYHGTMYGKIVVSIADTGTITHSNSLSNVRTVLVNTTELALLSTPLVFTNVFTTTDGATKPLDSDDKNLLVVSLLKKGATAGYVSDYSLLHIPTDMANALPEDASTVVTHESATRLKFTSTSYFNYLEFNIPGSISEGQRLSWTVDRHTAYTQRYQPFSIRQDGDTTDRIAVYANYVSSSPSPLYYNVDSRPTSSDIVFGNGYEDSGSSATSLKISGAELDNYTALIHSLIFETDPTNADVFDVQFELTDQDGNLIFRVPMILLNSKSSYFGSISSPQPIYKNATGFKLRLWAWSGDSNQTVPIWVSNMHSVVKNKQRDSFTPLNGSSYPPNQTYSS